MGPAGCLPLQEDKYRGTLDTNRRPGTWGAPWLWHCLPRSHPSQPCTHQQGSWEASASWPGQPTLGRVPTCPEQSWRLAQEDTRPSWAAGRVHGDTSSIPGVSKHFYKRHCPQGTPRSRRTGVSPRWNHSAFCSSQLPNEAKAINLGVWEADRGQAARPNPNKLLVGSNCK